MWNTGVEPVLWRQNREQAKQRFVLLTSIHIRERTFHTIQKRIQIANELKSSV